MQLDNVLVEIITKVQKEVHKKYNIEVDFDTIHDIIHIQCVATAFAFSRKIPIAWKGFIKFIWTDRVNRNKETNELIKTINSPSYDLTEKEREYFRYLAVVNSAKRLKELKTINQQSTAITKDELIALPTRTPHFMDFKILCKKKKT